MENLCPCNSGKQFAECHALYQPLVTQPVIIAPPLATRKLDLACGQSCREGFEGVDIWKGAQHVWDLMQFPWPFEDNSVEELHCSHFVEHIPQYPLINGKNPFFAFFDECYRILIPGGWMTVIVPNAFSNGGFQDPTHTRYIVAQSFLYLSKEWLTGNKLEHYNSECNFGIDVAPIVSSDMNLKHQEAQMRMMNNEVNQVHAWQARLKSLKPALLK